MASRCPNTWCCSEALQIKDMGISNPGRFYCGTELTLGQEIKSKGGKVVLFYYKEATPENTKKGFKLTTAFEPIPGCVPAAG